MTKAVLFFFVTVAHNETYFTEYDKKPYIEALSALSQTIPDLRIHTQIRHQSQQLDRSVDQL